MKERSTTPRVREAPQVPTQGLNLKARLADIEETLGYLGNNLFTIEQALGVGAALSGKPSTVESERSINALVADVAGQVSELLARAQNIAQAF